MIQGRYSRGIFVRARLPPARLTRASFCAHVQEGHGDNAKRLRLAPGMGDVGLGEGGAGREGTRKFVLDFRDGRNITLSSRVLAGSAVFGIGKSECGSQDYLRVTSLDAVNYVSGRHCHLSVCPGLPALSMSVFHLFDSTTACHTAIIKCITASAQSCRRLRFLVLLDLYDRAHAYTRKHAEQCRSSVLS